MNGGGQGAGVGGGRGGGGGVQAKKGCECSGLDKEKEPHGPGKKRMVSRDPPSLAEPTRCPRVTFLVSPRKTVSCIQTKSYFARVATRIQRVAGVVWLVSMLHARDSTKHQCSRF